MTEISQIDLHGWNCVRMEAGQISAALAPEIGGRIVSLKFRGEELLYIDETRGGEKYDFTDADLIGEKQRLGFGLWGGDKTWIAPQAAWSENIPPLELDAGQYSHRLRNNSLIMTSPSCRETGILLTRTFSMEGDGKIRLEQEIKNISSKPVERGIWNVTQFLRPFDFYFPVRKALLRPYSEEGESVSLYDQIVREEGGWTVVPCREKKHFKFGALCEGKCAAVRDDMIHIRRFSADLSARYAHDSSVEVYNSPHAPYMEFEVHAPLKILQPGETQKHSQDWFFLERKGPLADQLP